MVQCTVKKSGEITETIPPIGHLRLLRIFVLTTCCIYINRYQRLSYTENPDTEYEKKYTVSFADGVVSRAEDLSITKNGVVLKEGNDVILPLTEDNMLFIAYSENGKDGEWNVPDAEFTKAKNYNITAYGNEYISDVTIADKKYHLTSKQVKRLQ